MLAAAMCICILALMGAGSLSKADNAGQMYTYSAAASFVCDANGTITAYKGNKNAEQIIVPATINGRTVTGISNNVFKGCEKLLGYERRGNWRTAECCTHDGFPAQEIRACENRLQAVWRSNQSRAHKAERIPE